MEISGSYGGRAVAGENPVVNGSGPPPFISKTYVMVDDPATDWIVSWGAGNNSFVVWKPPEFARELLPKCFKHNNFASFVRQLNTYGFRKIDPDRWEFAHEEFLRGQKPLLTNINRRKSSHAHNQPQSLPCNVSFASCVEMGKFWLVEDIERLKRDKNVLMQELLRLRQQQQTTDTLLQALTEHTQRMEQHQQQMLSFLFKAIQNPELLAQLVQQKSSNNQNPVGNEKRRLPNQKKLEREIASSDGQIINYQRTLLTDAAKSTLMQILTSDRSDSFSKPEGIAQLGNFHLPTDSIDNSRIPYDPGKNLISVPLEEISQAVIDCQECNQVQGILADESIVNIPSMRYLRSEAESTLVIPHAGFDEMISFELENFSGDAEFDIFKVGPDMKLPSVVDSFWTQFL